MKFQGSKRQLNCTKNCMQIWHTSTTPLTSQNLIFIQLNIFYNQFHQTLHRVSLDLHTGTLKATIHFSENISQDMFPVLCFHSTDHACIAWLQMWFCVWLQKINLMVASGTLHCLIQLSTTLGCFCCYFACYCSLHQAIHDLSFWYVMWSTMKDFKISMAKAVSSTIKSSFVLFYVMSSITLHDYWARWRFLN